MLSVAAVLSGALATILFWSAGSPAVGFLYLGVTIAAAAFTWHTHRLLQQEESDNEMEKGS